MTKLVGMTGKNVNTEMPRRLCFGFQITLLDESLQAVATSLGFDSIVHDPLYEAWDEAEFTRRAMNKLRKRALAMCARYPGAVTASYQTRQCEAVNSAWRVVSLVNTMKS